MITHSTEVSLMTELRLYIPLDTKFRSF